MNINGQIEIEDDIIDILSDEEDSLDGIKVDILYLEGKGHWALYFSTT